MSPLVKIIIIVALVAVIGAFVYFKYQGAAADSERMGRDLELIQEVLQEQKQRATAS